VDLPEQAISQKLPLPGVDAVITVLSILSTVRRRDSFKNNVPNYNI
jgi:hypothetical protein